jgi:hypothetical protein
VQQRLDVECRPTHNDGDRSSLQDCLDPFRRVLSETPRGEGLREVELIDEMVRHPSQLSRRRLRRSDRELPVDLAAVGGNDLAADTLG